MKLLTIILSLLATTFGGTTQAATTTDAIQRFSAVVVRAMCKKDGVLVRYNDVSPWGTPIERTECAHRDITGFYDEGTRVTVELDSTGSLAVVPTPALKAP
jgi:hypothetical protein